MIKCSDKKMIIHLQTLFNSIIESGYCYYSSEAATRGAL